MKKRLCAITCGKKLPVANNAVTGPMQIWSSTCCPYIRSVNSPNTSLYLIVQVSNATKASIKGEASSAKIRSLLAKKAHTLPTSELAPSTRAIYLISVRSVSPSSSSVNITAPSAMRASNERTGKKICMLSLVFLRRNFLNCLSSFVSVNLRVQRDIALSDSPVLPEPISQAGSTGFCCSVLSNLIRAGLLVNRHASLDSVYG